MDGLVKEMIVVYLCGGLGNQLFQYSAARRLAIMQGEQVTVDCSWYEKKHGGVTQRNFDLCRYRVDVRKLSKGTYFARLLWTNRFLSRLPFPRKLQLVSEKCFSFSPNILSLGTDVYLKGYWQSYKYFEDIRGVLLADLVPTLPFTLLDQNIAEKISKCASVSIHVRRGDYVTLASAANTHGTCSLEYYQSAVNLLQSRIKGATFFVFSDDPEWTAANLHFDAPTVYVDHNDASTAFQDLRLMSICEHQIIANSSFSWWGAWLNQNPSKMVVAPKRWFANLPDVTSDLYPADWIKI